MGWDQPGTRSVHLEQTHEIVKLFRDILDVVALGVALITEINAPYEENISYLRATSLHYGMASNTSFETSSSNSLKFFLKSAASFLACS